MKTTPHTRIRAVLSTASLAALTWIHAAEIVAPNKGRIITSVQPNAELLVSAEKKIEIRFLEPSGKVVTPTTQIATITMGERSNPTTLTFAINGDKLVSDITIPDAAKQPLVLKIQINPEATPVTEKFTLDLSICPTCSHAEYACTCDHH